MKKIITSLFAMLCVVSASAVTVTVDGKPVESGTTLTFGANDFTVEQAGTRYYYTCESTLQVADAQNLVITGTAASSEIQICEVGQSCYPWVSSGSGYTFTQNCSGNLTVHLSIRSTETTVPKVNETADVTFKYDGGEFKLTFVYDTNQAGISAIEADGGVYVVYSLSGVKVLETADKAEINNLPAGIYIVNGKKISVK